MTRILSIAVALVALAGRAQAQPAPLLNPGTVVFTASADHAVVDLGVPILTDYALEFVGGGLPTPVQSLSIGKPTPVANDITVDLAALRPKLTSLKPGTYTLQVVARGPGGNTASVASAPFTLAPRAPIAPGPVRLQPSVAKASSPGSLNSPSLTVAARFDIAK